MSAQHSSTNSENLRRIPSSTVLLLLVLFVAVLAAWPLIGEPGFLNTRGGGDSPFLLQRLQQLETAVRDGHFPVRWMPDANYGYGYPFFNYYAPLSIYIAFTFRLFGFSIVRSIELAQLAGFLFAAWGMFLLARRWLQSEWAGLLASIAYTVAPFHLVNIYVRGDSLAEFWAMAWYPWIFLAVDYLLEYKGTYFPHGRVAAFAIAYAALILSHNISALIFSPFLLLYLLLRASAWRRSAVPDSEAQGGRQKWPIWQAIVLAIALAFALAAWFFLPALAEQDLAQLDPVTSGFFHYSNHFRGVDLVQQSVFFDYTVAGGKAFRLGLIQALVTLAGVVALILITIRRRLVSPAVAIFIFLALVLAIFMITPLSRFLWDSLPLLPFTQFPWRFLSVQAFASALAVAALALLPGRKVLVPVLSIVLIVGSLAGLETDHLLLADEDISSRRLAEYEWFTGNIGSTVSAEYLPQTVQPRPFTSSWLTSGTRNDLRTLDGELLQTIQLERQTGQQTWKLTAAELGATLVFPTLHWPGWRAVVDGQETEIAPAPGSGLIMLYLPPGAHTVELQLGKTTERRIAELISIVALLAVIIFLFKARRIPGWSSSALLVLSLLLVGLLLLRFWPSDPLSARNMTWDFAHMGYLHHDELGVPFDNGVVLLGYEYDRETIAAGEELTISVSFDGADGHAVDLIVGTPAVAWPAFEPDAPFFAEQTQIVAANQARFTLNLPKNIPGGLVLPRISIPDGQPLTPSGHKRGDIYLRPLYINSDRAVDGVGPELDVRALDIKQEKPDRFEVQLAWTARRQLVEDYNVSLRLLDREGHWLSQLDVQPGYGFLPSSGWPIGTEINDWLAMSLPPGLPEDTPLALVLRLYDVGSGTAVLSRRLGDITYKGDQLLFAENEPVFDLPHDLQSLPVDFGEGIRLHGYKIDQAETVLSVYLYWEALSEGQPDYTRFVHLFDSQTDEIVAQSDGQPRNDSYPTSQWTTGEIVTDTTVFDMVDVDPGNYHLGIGFYRPEGESLLHLTAVHAETQETYPSNRALLPEKIEWRAAQD